MPKQLSHSGQGLNFFSDDIPNVKDILEPTGYIPEKLQLLKTLLRANLLTAGGQILLQTKVLGR